MATRREFIHAAGLAAATGLVTGADPATAAAQGAGSAPATAAPRTLGAKFRALLRGPEPFAMIAVHDVLSARMTEMAGFPSLMLGSTAVAEALGVPDWSVVSDSERIEFYGRISDSVAIPAMADLDEGGFTPLTLYRSVKAYEKAGVGVVHLCDGKALLGTTNNLYTIKEMVDRIHAAVDARSDTVVTARIQGFTSEGRDKTIERANAYREAGAEAIWYLPGPPQDLPQIVKAAPVPAMMIMRATTTMAEVKQAEATVAVYATFVQNLAMGAVYTALNDLKATGSFAKSAGQYPGLAQVIPTETYAKLLATEEYRAQGKKFGMQ